MTANTSIDTKAEISISQLRCNGSTATATT